MTKKPINYNGRYTITVKELIKQGYDILPSNYNFYDPSHKEEFEKKFIRHYKNYEIGIDNYEEWQEELLDLLEINYPKYKHYFDTQVVAKGLRWWYNKDYDVEHNITINRKDSATNHNTSIGNNINKYIGKMQDESNSTNRYLDTPQGRVEAIDDGYITNASKDNSTSTANSSGNNESNSTNESNSENNRQGTDTHTIRNKEYGNIGTTSSGDLVRSWLEDGYFNIDKMIIEDALELFMFIFN